MQSIELKHLIELGDKARKIISNHPDYQFHIKDRYAYKFENGEEVYCAHSMYFDVILSESWRIISQNSNEAKSFKKLLKKIWYSEILKANGMSFKDNLRISLNEFITLSKRQFFYFDSGDEQFLFPLFRIIEDNEDVTGGFFHFLIDHFEMYNRLTSSSNDQTEYSPNDVLGVLVSTSIWPDTIEKEDTRNQEDDFVSIRSRECRYYSKKTNKYETKKFKAVLYYDNKSSLFLLTTFHRC